MVSYQAFSYEGCIVPTCGCMICLGGGGMLVGGGMVGVCWRWLNLEGYGDL